MSTFKIKGDKKYIHDTRITVDAKHQKIIKEFKKKKNKLPKLQEKLNSLKLNLKNIRLKDNTN